MDRVFTLPSNIIQLDFPSLPTASGCCFKLENMELMLVDPRSKAKVAWRGGDELFHHKLPTVCLRFGLSTFVRVAERNMCFWAVSEYCCQRLARSLRSPTSSSRSSNSCRQRLAFSSNAAEPLSALSSAAERSGPCARQGESRAGNQTAIKNRHVIDFAKHSSTY